MKRNWARGRDGSSGASTHVIERGAELTAEHEWVIVNYDVLNKHIATLGGIPRSGSTSMRPPPEDHRSARSRLARQLADRAKAQAGAQPAVYLLTGTPLTNRPRDLFVLLQLVGHPLGRSFVSFAKRYCAAEGRRLRLGDARSLEHRGAHGAAARRGVRRSKDDVLALPPKIRTWLPVECRRAPAFAT